MSYFIGIDVGTSATKSVLFDETGKIIFSNSSEYELIQPQNGWVQQRPNDWKNATVETLKSIAQKVSVDEIKGIGVSGQMHGLVVLDENNNVLYDSIIWCDQRTEKEVNQIIDTIGKERYIDLTLNAPNTSFTLSKLLWLKNNEPDILKKTRKILLPKDYINFCLTGVFSTDVSDASGTGYFDVKGRCWSEEILNAFDINEKLLPQVYESIQVVGNITENIALQTGLSTNTIVVAGAGDQAASAVGNGVIKPGCTSISLGTSGVVFTAVDKPVCDKFGKTHTFCHAVKNMWHIMGVTQGCGLSVNWFRKNFAQEYSYAELDENTKEITSDGIIYLPYLMGERTPHLDPNCRGSFTGISVNHNCFNFYRAVLEGVCFSIKDCCEVICESGIDLNTIKVGGGGAKSKLWLQILADTITENLYTSKCVESGVLGVAILASVGSGYYKSVEEASAKMTDSNLSMTRFNPGKINYYNSTYSVYKNLYFAVKSALENKND